MTDRRPPVVGIPSSSIAPAASSIPRYGQNQAYIHAVVRAGAAPVMIPHLGDEAQLRPVYKLLDGLLLPGGVDVDPARYGESRHEKCGLVDPARDELETTLTRWALEDGKPVLAICRGTQMLNVTLGGSLYQDIAFQLPGADKHDWYPGFARDRLSHRVAIDAGSCLSGFLGADSLVVNSMHHQAIKALAPGLSAVGYAPDGIIEAVELKDHPLVVGVQWHPEELAAVDRLAQGLFDAWVEACGKHE